MEKLERLEALYQMDIVHRNRTKSVDMVIVDDLVREYRIRGYYDKGAALYLEISDWRRLYEYMRKIILEDGYKVKWAFPNHTSYLKRYINEKDYAECDLPEHVMKHFHLHIREIYVGEVKINLHGINSEDQRLLCEIIKYIFNHKVDKNIEDWGDIRNNVLLLTNPRFSNHSIEGMNFRRVFRKYHPDPVCQDLLRLIPFALGISKGFYAEVCGDIFLKHLTKEELSELILAHYFGILL